MLKSEITSFDVCSIVLYNNVREYIAQHYCPDNCLGAPERPFTKGELDMDKFREMSIYIMDTVDEAMGLDTAWYRQGNNDEGIKHSLFFRKWACTFPEILNLPCFDSNIALQTLADLNELPIGYLKDCEIDAENAVLRLAILFNEVLEESYKIKWLERFDE